MFESLRRWYSFLGKIGQQFGEEVKEILFLLYHFELLCEVYLFESFELSEKILLKGYSFY